MALDATPGGTSANSYATLAEAEAYMATLVFKTAWAAASDPTKTAALQLATRTLDAELNYQGVQAASTQALQWPRVGAIDRNGWPISSTTLPVGLVNATAEFAFRLIESDRLKDAGAIVPSRVKAGSLELENLRRQVVPDSVLALVRDLLISGGEQPLVVRG